MTLAAYERSGGVLTALADYAGGALTDCLTATGATPEAARRLFQQLARPDGQGGFTRRALPIARLEPEQAALARALAARRLLVWDVRDTPSPPVRPAPSRWCTRRCCGSGARCGPGSRRA